MARIFLIDDDRDDAELFREALEEINSGLHFHYYDDGLRAVQELSETKTVLPDIIFLDINMPVISGWECLKRLKETQHLAAIPVIMYTTSSLNKEKEIAQDLGAAGFITKPNDFKLVKETISAAIETNLRRSN